MQGLVETHTLQVLLECGEPIATQYWTERVHPGHANNVPTTILTPLDPYDRASGRLPQKWQLPAPLSEEPKGPCRHAGPTLVNSQGWVCPYAALRRLWRRAPKLGLSKKATKKFISTQFLWWKKQKGYLYPKHLEYISKEEMLASVALKPHCISKAPRQEPKEEIKGRRTPQKKVKKVAKKSKATKFFFEEDSKPTKAKKAFVAPIKEHKCSIPAKEQEVIEQPKTWAPSRLSKEERHGLVVMLVAASRGGINSLVEVTKELGKGLNLRTQGLADNIAGSMSQLLNSGKKLDQAEQLLDRFESLAADKDNTLPRMECLVSKLEVLSGDNSIEDYEKLVDRVEKIKIGLADEEKALLTDMLETCKKGIGVNVNIAAGSAKLWEVILAVVLSLALMLLMPNIWMALGILLLGVLFTGLISKIFKWISQSAEDIKTLCTKIPNDENLQTEGTWDELTPIITRIVTSGVANLMALGDERKVPHYVKAGGFAQSLNSINSLQEAVIKGISCASEALWEINTGLPSSMKDESEQLLLEVELWMKTLDETIHDRDWLTQLSISKEHREILNEQLSYAVDLQMRLGLNEKCSKYPIHGIINHLRTLQKSVVSMSKPTQSRPVPVFVALTGPTSIGKTWSINRMVLDLFAREDLDFRKQYKTFGKLKYAKSAGSDYWDGYEQNYVIFMDELFCTDLKEDISIAEAASLLNIVSNSDTPMNVAECAYKNKIIPNSPFVLATTNVTNWNQLKLNHVPALLQRRHFMFRPILHPQFRVAAGDNYKLNVAAWLNHCQANNLDSTIPNFCQYQLIDAEGQPQGQYDYNQVIDMIWQRRVLHKQYYQQNQNRLEEDFRRLINQSDDKKTSRIERILLKIKNLSVSDTVMIEQDKIKECIPDGNWPELDNFWTQQDGKEKNTVLYKLFWYSSAPNKLTTDFYKGFVPFTIPDNFDKIKYIDLFTKNIEFPVKKATRTFCEKFKDCVRNYPYHFIFGTLGVVASLVALGVGLYFAFRKKKVVKEPTSEEIAIHNQVNLESWSKGQSTSRKAWKNKIPFRKVESQDTLENQSITDANWESMKFRVIQNLTRVEAINGLGQKIKSTQGLIVASDRILAPAHVIAPGTISVYFRGLHTYKFLLNELEIINIGDRWKHADVILIKIPKNKMPAVSIVKFFATVDQIEKISDVNGELIIMPREGEDEIYRICTSIMTQEEHLTRNPNEPITTDFGQRALVGWSYMAPTKPGDCGAPLCQWNPACPGKILGIHIAASPTLTSRGFAAIVDRDWLEEHIPKLMNHGDDFPETLPSWVSPQMIITSRTAPQNSINMPMSTKIVPSDLASSLPYKPKTKPVFLTETNLQKACLKYRKQPVIIRDVNIERLVRTEYYNHIRMFSCGKLLSWEETLNSFENQNSINMNSSMGYPYVVQGLKKHDIIKFDEEQGKFLFSDLEFLQELISYEEAVMKGTAYYPIWATYMKDERIDNEKVDEGKVRLFSASPFNFTLLCRKYFGTFLNVLRQKGKQMGIMIGLDVHSEWDWLAKKILSVTQTPIFIDWKNWDKHLPQEFMEPFFQMADYYYADEGKVVRDFIKQAIMQPEYQIRNLTYYTLGGNPSGCAFTAELNSISNLIVCKAILMKYFTPLVVSQTFIPTWGDDAIICCPERVDTFKFRDDALQLGMTVTGLDKSTYLSALPLTEGKFLNRRFKYDKGIWSAPLELQVLVDMLLWSIKGPNRRLAMQSTIDNFFIEIRKHSDVGVLIFHVINACDKWGYNYPFDEFVMENLQKIYCTESSINIYKSVFMTIYIKFLQQLWDTFPVERQIFNAIGNVKVIGIRELDVSVIFPILPKGVFVHAGLDIGNRELTFGSEGVVTISKDTYKPTNYIPLQPFELTPFEIMQQPAPYHKINNNCLTFVTKTLSGHYFYKQAQALKDWCRENQNWLTQGNETLTQEVGCKQEQVARVIRPQTWRKAGKAKTRTVIETIETGEVLCTTQWIPDQVVDTVLLTCKLPQELYKIDQIASKIKFNAFLRGKLVMDLKVATNQYMAGSLIMYYVPLGDMGYAGNTQLHVFSTTCMTSVRFNASTMSCATLEIPFVHTQNFIQITSKRVEDTMGHVIVRIVNPLKTGESTARPTVRLLVHFADIEVQIPTPITSVSHWGSTKGAFYPSIITQGDEDLEKSEKQVLSVSENSNSSLSFLQGIPIVSNVIDGFRAISKAVDPIISALGFSKPNSIETTRPMIPRIFTGVSHFDGLDMSVPLSTDPRNSVAINPSLFGSEVDELNIARIIEKPMLVGQVEWITDHPANTTLLSIPVTPLLGTKMTTTLDKVEFPVSQLTPLGYVAMAFEYWRGKIVFSIEVVGTSFHKGILLVYFVPQGGNIYDDAIEGEVRLTEVSTKKLNLTESNILICECDFTSPRLYQKVGEIFSQSVNTDEAIGTLNIKVFNTLICPSTLVSNHVDINIWMSAAPNFRFALPTMRRIQHVNYGYTNLDKLLEEYIFVQGDESKTEIAGKTEARPLAYNFDFMTTEDYAFDEVVMGETMLSLRNLLKIFTKKFSGRTPGKSPSESINIPVHRFKTTIDNLPIEDTYYDHFMRLFRFSRGSMRHKLTLQTRSNTVSASMIIDAVSSYEWFINEYPVVGAPWTITATQLNPTLEYSVPYYQSTKSIVHGNVRDNRSINLTFDTLEANRPCSFELYEAIGDDFSAGYMMGPPAVFSKVNLDIPKMLKLVLDKGTIQKTYGNSSYPLKTTAVGDSTAKVLGQKISFGQLAYGNIIPEDQIYAFDSTKITITVAGAKIIHSSLKEVLPPVCFLITGPFYADAGSVSWNWQRSSNTAIYCGAWFNVTHVQGQNYALSLVTSNFEDQECKFYGDPVLKNLRPALDLLGAHGSGNLHLRF